MNNDGNGDGSDLDPRPLKNRVVKYMFEASDFEYSRLWLEWHDHIDSWDERPKVDLPTFVRVGELAGHPVNVQITWNRLNGHLVGFYWGCSNVVDNKMVEDWLDQNFCPPMPMGGTHRRQDASNFKNGLIDLGIDWKPFK